MENTGGVAVYSLAKPSLKQTIPLIMNIAMIRGWLYDHRTG
jgi:hypothetical protein